MKRTIAAILLFSTLGYKHAVASELVLESTGARTSVLELYTSEGCSSCPPADRFMSYLTAHPRLWTELIPVAFHVDYWDYIGWRDRFASPDYSARQYDYARAESVGTVYTPGFVLNGAEWRGKSVRDLNVEPTRAGRLTAVVNESTVTVGYDQTEIENPVVTVALLGFGLSSDVDAGENTGRMLQHDFVVLALEQTPLEAVRDALTASARLPNSDHGAERTAIAVWVSAQGQPHPLQAVGGWLN